LLSTHILALAKTQNDLWLANYYFVHDSQVSFAKIQNGLGTNLTNERKCLPAGRP
jgi:hypothetical protein